MKFIFTKVLIFTFIFAFFVFSPLMAQQPHIKIVPMSSLVKDNLGLGPEFFVSTGLQNVGKGEHIYLQAVDREGKEITAYSWEIAEKPTESEADIQNAAEDVYYLVADVVGEYLVKLTITTEDGTADVERILSANLYRGPGGVGGVATSFPQCGICHSSIRDKWITTDHATIFQRGIDGQVPGFGSTRQRTATTGTSEADLESGSFFSLKAETGWEFPTPPAPGTFEQLVNDHPDLAQVAVIGCESCHGAGSLHVHNAGDRNLMKKSFNSESCSSCHDAARPTAQFHSFRRSAHVDAIWSNSFMNRDGSNSLQDCVRCHDGRAYVNFTKGVGTNTSSDVYGADIHVTVTCETCHDPHAGGLRKAPQAADTLSGGFAYNPEIFGHGATCTDCHKFRADGYYEVLNTNVTVRWGPHYGGATDVMLGKSAYTFDTELPRSMAHLHQGNACADCHMSTAGGAFRNQLGDHSWKMRFTDDEGQTRDLVESCNSCHPGISSFSDIMGADYNMSGTVEPFVDEVQGLLTMLATALPPVGEPTITWSLIDNDNLEMKGAYWNYRYVYYDHSLGIHNPKFVVALLQKSIESITSIRFENTPDIPEEYALAQNYPNPFNPTTQIQFSIPEQANVTLTIYDITGREVTKLVNEALGTGMYTATWDGRNANGQLVSSGVYLYRIQAGSFVQTKRMVFIK
jgi:hypothetical protein